MKKISFLALIIWTCAVMAEPNVLLVLKKEKPFFYCEISAGSVSITRSSQGIKFSKKVSYEMDDLTPLIKKAFESSSVLNLIDSDYMAQNENVFFKLYPDNADALKLINLMSTFCEVRNK